MFNYYFIENSTIITCMNMRENHDSPWCIVNTALNTLCSSCNTALEFSHDENIPFVVSIMMDHAGEQVIHVEYGDYATYFSFKDLYIIFLSFLQRGYKFCCLFSLPQTRYGNDWMICIRQIFLKQSKRNGHQYSCQISIYGHK